LQALIETQHALAFGCQPGAAAALAADAAFHQRVLREVVQFVDGVPGRFVAQAGAFRRAGDRALLGDMREQSDALRATMMCWLREVGRDMGLRFDEMSGTLRARPAGVKSGTRFGRARQAVHVDLPRSGLHQQTCQAMGGRTGGEHVVDQRKVAVLYRHAMRQAEGAAQVALAALGVERLLRDGFMGA